MIRSGVSGSSCDGRLRSRVALAIAQGRLYRFDNGPLEVPEVGMFFKTVAG